MPSILGFTHIAEVDSTPDDREKDKFEDLHRSIIVCVTYAVHV